MNKLNLDLFNIFSDKHALALTAKEEREGGWEKRKW
jgi:hypothetical protein